MAWQDTATCLLRTLIADDVEPYDYATAKLEQILVNCAYLITAEVTFTNTYTVNVVGCTVTPDPVDSNEPWFVNLVVLKSACVIAGAEYKTKANQAISFKDGPATIDAKGISKEYKERYQRLCDDYEMAKIQYLAGESIVGAAVIGPYTTNGLGPQSLLGE